MPGHSPVSWGSAISQLAGSSWISGRRMSLIFSGKEKKGLLPEKDDGREKCGHNGRDLSAAPVRSAVEVLIRTAEVFNAVLLDRIERLTKEDIERYRARLRPLLEWKGSFPKRSPFVKAKGIGITQGPRRIHHPGPPHAPRSSPSERLPGNRSRLSPAIVSWNSTPDLQDHHPFPSALRTNNAWTSSPMQSPLR